MRRILAYELPNEDDPKTEEERIANRRGADAYHDGWHRNPYPVGSNLHRFWQIGHDAAAYYDHNAW